MTVPQEPWIEIHLLPHEGRRRRWRLRIADRSWRWVRRGLVFVSALVLTCWVHLIFFASSKESLAARRRAEVKIGQHLRERHDGLKAELTRLRDAAHELESRISRIEGIYELALLVEAQEPREASRVLGSSAARLVDVELAVESLRRELALLRRRVDRVADRERARPVDVAMLPVRPPIRGASWVLVGGFGPYRNPFTGELEFQTGVRLAAPRGTPVRAVAAGMVTFAGVLAANRPGDLWRFGKLVAVRHGEEFLTLYGHCDGLRVREGVRVGVGEVLAEVSDSGWAFGPQIYFELRRKRQGRWVPLDPLSYWIGLPLPEGWNRRNPPEDLLELPSEMIR